MLGSGVLLSVETTTPLTHTFLIEESVRNTAESTQEISDTDANAAFDRLLINGSWVLTNSFFL